MKFTSFADVRRFLSTSLNTNHSEQIHSDWIVFLGVLGEALFEGSWKWNEVGGAYPWILIIVIDDEAITHKNVCWKVSVVISIQLGGIWTVEDRGWSGLSRNTIFPHHSRTGIHTFIASPRNSRQGASFILSMTSAANNNKIIHYQCSWPPCTTKTRPSRFAQPQRKGEKGVACVLGEALFNLDRVMFGKRRGCSLFGKQMVSQSII